MFHKKIVLSKKRNVSLTTYLLDPSQEFHSELLRPMIIVCPGGGYQFLSDREAEIIALQFNSAGFHAAVLRYGIEDYAIMPGPICDLADAMAYIRTHFSEYKIDSDNIFVCGFSAGAHVAAGLSVFWNNQDIMKKYKDNLEMIKPNGSILCYPVIDLYSSSTHLDIGIKKNTKMEDIQFGQVHPKIDRKEIFIFDKKEKRYFINFEVAMNAFMFGGAYTKEQEDFYSLQNQVNTSTPPAFLWHGGQDGLIFPKNSLLYAEKLSSFHIPYELHIFGEGDHGLSLANYICSNNKSQISPCCEPWMDLAITWINSRSHFAERASL